MPAATFGKRKRLLTSAEYGYVFDQASYKVSHQHYLVLARTNSLGWARLGLVVAKKNSRLATRRNRIKRVVRDTFRNQQQFLDSLDIIFMARRGFDALLPAQQTQLLQEAWVRLAKKGGSGS